MKVILSGGGTGGHIYPALTIADQIKKLCPDADISFVGTQQGLEKDIIPRYGYPLKFIEVAGFRRSLSLDTLRSAAKLVAGLYDAYRIIKNERPDLVIGTGGYVCGPIVFMAALHGIPNVAKLPIDPRLAACSDGGLMEVFSGDWLDGMADAVEKL